MVPRFWMWAAWLFGAAAAVLGSMLIEDVGAPTTIIEPDPDRVIIVAPECYRGYFMGGFEPCTPGRFPARWWLVVQTPAGDTYEAYSASQHFVGQPWPP